MTLVVVMSSACLHTLPLSAQDQSIALTEAPLNSGRLSKWGVRRYQVSTISMEGKQSRLTPVYQWIMETQLKGPNVILHDSWEEQDGTLFIDIYCRPQGHLPIEKLAISRKVEDKLGVLGSILIQDGEAHAKMGAAIDRFAFPDDTLLFAAACRVVTLLPRTQNIRYTFSRFSDTREIRVQHSPEPTSWYFESLGRFRISTGKEKVICTKYEMRAADRKVTFYVDDEDTLQRIREGNLFIDLVRASR
jgi:hypothetical protein